MKFNQIAMATALVVLSINAQARGRAEARENHQQARIEQGMKSGELTAHEANKLERGQERVEKAQSAAAADGNVTPTEKAKLERMQDRQSRRIFKEKHDAQEQK